MTLAVLGHTGVVGGAIYNTVKDHYPTIGVSIENLADYDLIKDAEVIFLCVPTPMDQDGTVDMHFIHDAMQMTAYNNKGCTIVIKSTVLPGTNKQLSTKYPAFTFISSPEFLTAKQPLHDFQHQDRVIIGTENEVAGQQLEAIYRSCITCTKYIYTKPIEAEVIKYLSNSFLAMKVIFANEAKRLTDTLGADWDMVAYGMGTDTRIGTTHLKVDRGYNGMCFPKDVSGLVKFAQKQGISLSLLEQTDTVNRQLRPELYLVDLTREAD